VQLTATAAFSDGTRQDVTIRATWTSSNLSVATIAPTGVISGIGPGDVEIRVAYQGVADQRSIVVQRAPVPPPSYVIRGIVHESAPTAHVLLPDVRIEVIGGALGGQVFVADHEAHFQLPAVTSAGFALKFKARGYDDAQFDVVQLPRDQTIDIGLVPRLVTVRQVFAGDLGPACRAKAQEQVSFPVHNSGNLTFHSWWLPLTGSDPGGWSLALYRGNELVQAVGADCERTDCDPHVFTVFPTLQAGFLYRLEITAALCQPVTESGVFRLVFSHPN